MSCSGRLGVLGPGWLGRQLGEKVLEGAAAAPARVEGDLKDRHEEAREEAKEVGGGVGHLLAQPAAPGDEEGTDQRGAEYHQAR